MKNKNPIMVEAGKKAARTKKLKIILDKVHKSYLNCRIHTKVALTKKGYKSITFESKRGYEFKGINDLVAIKRNNKKPDELKIVLFQLKGGSARISKAEIERLKKAVKKVKISWNVAEKKGRSVKFYEKID